MTSILPLKFVLKDADCINPDKYIDLTLYCIKSLTTQAYLLKIQGVSGK